MRHKWIDAIMNSDLPGPARAICHVLYHRADEHGNCFPSIPHLAKQSGYSTRAVKQHITAHLDGQWLRISRSRGRPNRYRLITPDQCTTRTTSSAPHAPVSSAPRAPVSSAPRAPDQCTTCPLTTPLTSKTLPTVETAEAVIDPVKAIFELGVAILKPHTSDKQARSLVGKLRKAKGDGEALEVLKAARDKTDPVAYIMAAANPRRKTKGEVRRERFEDRVNDWYDDRVAAIDAAEQSAQGSQGGQAAVLADGRPVRGEMD